MKKFISTLIGAFSLFTSFIQGYECTPACCDKPYYAGAFCGANFLEKGGNNIGLLLGFLSGYKFESGFQIEGELAYRGNEPLLKYYKEFTEKSFHHKLKKKIRRHVHKVNYNTYSLMGNAYYNIEGSYCNFYIGGGIGYGFSNFRFGRYYSTRRSDFLFQSIVGLGRNLWDHFNVSLEYRALSTTKHFRDNSIALSFRNYF